MDSVAFGPFTFDRVKGTLTREGKLTTDLNVAEEAAENTREAWREGGQMATSHAY